MNAALILSIVVMLASAAAGYAFCMVVVMLGWMRRPQPPMMSVTLNMDDTVMADYLRVRGYRVEIEKRLVN